MNDENYVSSSSKRSKNGSGHTDESRSTTPSNLNPQVQQHTSDVSTADAAAGVESSRGNDEFGSTFLQALEVHHEVTERHAPLPTPEEMKQYEEVLPGLADRITRMAEKSLDSSIEDQRNRSKALLRMASHEAWATTTVAILSIALPWLAFFRSLALGNATFTSITLIVGVMTAGAQVIRAVRAKPSERSAETDTTETE